MLDRAVECIKNIVDGNQCRICDKADGSRVRFPCGHTACDSCKLELEATGCLLCLTPPDVYTSITTTPDEPFTLRVKNASALKKAFEDTLHVDVDKRYSLNKSLSEQLKTEKEVFPTCIQAPVKYYNKRKSVKASPENKENLKIQYHPGERISPLNKMAAEKNNYVQQWLESTETRPRKPFADVDVNRGIICQNTCVKKRAHKILEKVYEKSGFQVQKSPNKKRTHLKTSLSLVNSQPKLNKYLKPAKQEMPKWSAKKVKKNRNSPKEGFQNNKNSRDESGIVMDEEVISINDSQSLVVDKDREAWLAVLKAGEKDVSELTLGSQFSENIRHTHLDVENSTREQNTFMYNKIRFLKRSSLSESCQFCHVGVTKHNQNQTAGQSEKVSLTIENKSLLITITVSNNKKAVQSYSKRSTYVQTDIQALLEEQAIATKIDDEDVSKWCGIESQDLFTSEDFQVKNEVDNIVVEKSKPAHPRITDSESDNDLNESSVIEVTADVHRSSDQLDYGVLGELGKNDLGWKPKFKKRGKTPASSDSSDKENFDPNKSKRRKLEKKSEKKTRVKKHLFK